MIARSTCIIDANVLIEAANNYYRFDHVPGFWAWLADSVADGVIRSVSLVAEEIESPSELVEWVGEQEARNLFVDISDPACQAEYSRMAEWVVGEPYGPEHIAKFLSGADLWIVAVARVNGWTVVTQEKSVGPGSKKIKIPNVCDQFGVEVINTFDLLARTKARF